MTVRDLIEQRQKLIERSKILEVLTSYLDTFLTKDDREAENHIVLDDEKNVSEESIRDIGSLIYNLYEVDTAKLLELEEREIN
jgi:hypothetical protein